MLPRDSIEMILPQNERNTNRRWNSAAQWIISRYNKGYSTPILFWVLCNVAKLGGRPPPSSPGFVQIPFRVLGFDCHWKEICTNPGLLGGGPPPPILLHCRVLKDLRARSTLENRTGRSLGERRRSLSRGDKTRSPLWTPSCLWTIPLQNWKFQNFEDRFRAFGSLKIM